MSDVCSSLQVGLGDLQQPLVARMAFHADAQRAPFALGKLPEALLGVRELGCQTIGHCQQVFPGLGRMQAAERLWVNPDCGLKTRLWNEVIPALTNMVGAAKKLRADMGC